MNHFYKYILLLFSLFIFEVAWAQRTDVSTLSVSVTWKYRDLQLHIRTDNEYKRLNLDTETQALIKLYGQDTITIGASGIGGSPSTWVSLVVEPDKTYNYEMQKTVISAVLKKLRKPSVQPNKQNLDIVVSPDNTKIGDVVFTVVDSKGKPLSGVQFENNTSSFNKRNLTNEKGEVMFKKLDQGNNIFSISKSYYKSQNNTVNVVAQKTTNVKITLHNEYGRLLVTVYDEHNQPMKGVQISESTFKNGGQTDDNGEFIIENIKEGKTTISTTIKDYQSQSNEINILSETTNAMKVSLLPQVAKKGWLTGIVKKEDTKRPVANAFIYINGQGMTKTDGNGRFSVEVAAGIVKVYATKIPDTENSRRYIATTPQDVLIKVGEKQFIEIEMIPEPVAPFELDLSEEDGKITSLALSLAFKDIKNTAEKTNFEVYLNEKRLENVEKMLNSLKIPAGVDSQRVEFQLLKEQYDLIRSGKAKLLIIDKASPDIPPFGIESPKLLVNREIKPGQGATIKGQIKDEAGKPVEGAHVTASNSSETAITGTNGEYTLKNVPEGLAQITAEKPGCAIPTTTLNVKKGEQVNINMESDKYNMKQSIENGNFVLHIQFTTGSAVIPDQYNSTLSELLDAINGLPDKHFVIEGHTDSDGSAEDNYRLSLKRANAVMDWLVRGKANKTALSTVGYGEERPVKSNDTKEGKTLNRRVAIIVK